MKMLYRKYYLVILLIVVSVCNTIAQTAGDYRSNAATMNWNAAASWQKYDGATWNASADYPGQNACGTCTVTIQNGHGVSVNVSPVNSIGTLNIGGGTSGSLTFGTFTLNVTNNLVVNTSATLALASGTITVSGTFTNNGTVSTSSTTGNKTFNDFTNNGTWTSAGESYTINGNYTNDNSFSIGTGTYTFAGTNKAIGGVSATTFTNMAVTGSYTNNFANLTTTNLTGVGSLTQGTNSKITLIASPAITTFNCNVNTPNTVQYNSTANIKTPTANTYHHLIINGTGNNVLANLTINGNLTVNTACLLLQSFYSINGTAGGVFLLNGTLYIGSTSNATASVFPTGFGTVTINSGSTVQYQTNGNQIINTDYTYHHLGILTGASNSIKTLSGSTLNVNGNLTIANSGGTSTLDATGSTIHLIGNISGGGNLNLSNGLLYVGGNYNNSGTFTGTSSSHLYFNGSTAQNYFGSTNTFNNLTINNASGLTVNNPINISNTFNLTNGIITNYGHSIITLLNGCSTSIGSSTSFVNGPLKIEKSSSGASTLNAPIGNGVNWRPLILNVDHTDATSVKYNFELSASPATSLGFSFPGSIDKVSNIRHYIIGRENVSNLNSATITAYYNTDDGVDDYTNLTLAKTTSSSWIDIGGTATANNNGNIASAAFTNIAPLEYLTIANKIGGTNYLGLGSETITCSGNSSIMCRNQNFVISYTATGTFNGPNTFTAQLSDEYGAWTAPFNIGSVVSTSSGTINATIPNFVYAGTAYRIRVIASDPIVFGSDNGSGFTINVIDPPVALAATSANSTGATLNWNAVVGAVSYYLDISTNSSFSAILPGFNNYYAGTGTSVVVSGLSALTRYYYRIRAFDSYCYSDNSNTIAFRTNGPAILFGATKTGGANNLGAIFSFDPATNTYSKKFDFVSGTSTGTNPAGQLSYYTNGKLYGFARSGGASSYGTLFEYDPSLNLFAKKVDLTWEGSSPYNGLTLNPSTGKYYGCTFNGGGSYGTILEYTPGNNAFTYKYQLSWNDGSNPYGSLLLHSNGTMYFNTTAATVNNNGSIISYTPGNTSVSMLRSFSGGDGSVYRAPWCEAQNGKLYAPSGSGNMVEFNPSGNAFTVKTTFTAGTHGSSAYGGLIEAINGKLYGLASSGGANGFGTVYSYDYNTNTLTKCADFNGTNGKFPLGTLIESYGGFLYGVTSDGGTSNLGVIFKFDINSNTITKLYDLTSTGGSVPEYMQLAEVCMPIVTSQPSNVTICGNGNAFFNVTVSGEQLSYQWQISSDSGFVNLTNNATYSGVNTTTLQVSSASANMHGAMYRCAITSICPGVVFSNAASLIVSNKIQAFAGTGTRGFSGDGGAATAANIACSGIAHDSNGNIYFCTGGGTAGHRVRKVNTSGVISTICGNGTASSTGDGGLATAATVNEPIGIAIDANDNIYIAEHSGHKIRKINTSGIISTFAGTGSASYSGDGGLATAATLYNPINLCVDNYGNLFIADKTNNRIRKINNSGVISTVAGGGGSTSDGVTATTAVVNNPMGVYVDNDDNIYISAQAEQRVRVVRGGVIYTLAGTLWSTGFTGDGGVSTSALLYNPISITGDGYGNIYFSDQFNKRIRKIDSDGKISTVAGNGNTGNSGNNGLATSAAIDTTFGVMYYNGELYITSHNNTVRKMPVLSGPIVNAGSDLVKCAGGVESIGGSPTASSGTPGYVYNWLPVTGLSSTTVSNPTTAINSTVVYTVTVTDANSCSSSDQVQVTVPANGGTGSWTWQGGQSVNWFDPCNWVQKCLPDVNSDVVIPGGTTFNPTISGATANCKTINITTSNGGHLTISTSGGGHLNVQP